MKVPRTAVEWGFKDVKKVCSTLDSPRKMKVCEGLVGLLCCTGSLVWNLRCRAYGSATATFFKRQPPSSNDHLGSLEHGTAVKQTATPSTSDKTPDSCLYTHDRCRVRSGVWTLTLRSRTGRAGAAKCVVVRRGASSAAMSRPAKWRAHVYRPIAGGMRVAVCECWRFHATPVGRVRLCASWGVEVRLAAQ